MAWLQLKELFPGLGVMLPPKRFFKDNYEKRFLDGRRLGLQTFLQKLTSHKEVVSRCVLAPITPSYSRLLLIWPFLLLSQRSCRNLPVCSWWAESVWQSGGKQGESAAKQYGFKELKPHQVTPELLITAGLWDSGGHQSSSSNEIVGEPERSWYFKEKNWRRRKTTSVSRWSFVFCGEITRFILSP